MSLVRLNITGISYSQTQNGAYALILNEINGSRNLPIVIGAYEAQAIAIALEDDIRPPRPLTHDLFKTFAERYSIIVKQVIIHKLVDGIFYSSLICERKGIEEIIDARTSDAIALALRFDAPIFTYKNILDIAGVEGNKRRSFGEDLFDEPESKDNDLELDKVEEFLKDSPPSSNVYSSKSLKELETLLSEAVSSEDYEKAARIRDEISKRN